MIGRRLQRLFLLIVLLTFIFFLTYLTITNEESMLIGTPMEVVDNDRKEKGSDSDVVEFASFQASQVRILSRKSKNGNLDMVLSIDSADIEELIQEHRSESVTANPFPMETKLILSNPRLCRDSPDLKWIVYVHTSCKNIERRDLLRQTWANTNLFRKHSFKVIFLMGTTNHDVQQDVRKEFERFGDIVQGDFIDTYKNLTLKGVMGLRWITENCPHVPYAVKTDDDSFVNIFQLIRLMDEYRSSPSLLVCPLWQNQTMKILRDRKTCMKWCVKRKELPGLHYFPQYCAGIAFVLSRKLVVQMYEASRRTPFFWIDDVYITGLLPTRIDGKVEYVDINKRMTLREDLAMENYKNKSQVLFYDVIHVHERFNFIELWNALLERLTKSEQEMLKEKVFAYKII